MHHGTTRWHNRGKPARPYVYIVIHKPTREIYVGSRSGAGCNPDEFFDEYFTSCCHIWKRLIYGDIKEWEWMTAEIAYGLPSARGIEGWVQSETGKRGWKFIGGYKPATKKAQIKRTTMFILCDLCGDVVSKKHMSLHRSRGSCARNIEKKELLIQH
jgi:hypothetical protein